MWFPLWLSRSTHVTMDFLGKSEAVLCVEVRKCSGSNRNGHTTGLLKTFQMKSRASISLAEINSSDCSARSMGDGFSIIGTAQLKLEGKIIRPHSVSQTVSVLSQSSGRN